MPNKKDIDKDKPVMGRPTKFKPEYADLTYKYCLLGATDADLAKFFEVEESTVNNWKIDFPDFLESIKRGKEEADANVAKSLYHRALGYEHPETKIVSYEGQITDQMDVTKHYPPDPTAAIFWLKNRQPDKWRDKIEVDQNISGNIEVTFSDPNLDEWAK